MGGASPVGRHPRRAGDSVRLLRNGSWLGRMAPKPTEQLPTKDGNRRKTDQEIGKPGDWES